MYIFSACRFLLCSLISTYTVLFDDSSQTLQLNRLEWAQLLNYLNERANGKFFNDRGVIKTQCTIESETRRQFVCILST